VCLMYNEDRRSWIKMVRASGLFIKISRTYYIDPYKLKKNGKSRYNSYNHSHYDHCSVADIEKIVQEGTKIVILLIARADYKINVAIKMEIVEPGKELDIGDVKISVPSCIQYR